MIELKTSGTHLRLADFAPCFEQVQPTLKRKHSEHSTCKNLGNLVCDLIRHNTVLCAVNNEDRAPDSLDSPHIIQSNGICKQVSDNSDSGNRRSDC